MGSVWEQFETTRAWRLIESASQALGVAPQHLGLLVGKRLKKRDLFTGDQAPIDLALEEAARPKAWEAWLPEEAFGVGLRLAEYAAASGRLDESAEIADNLPGRKGAGLYRRLVWRAGGSEEAPGLQALTKATSPENWLRQMNAAANWRNSNLETETRRLAQIRLAFPDFDPSTPKWGAYLRDKIAEAGIRMERAWKIDPALPQDEKTLVIGESHGRGPLEIMARISEEAARGASVLTVEEPKNGSWKPLMAFMLKTKKDWGPEALLEVALKESSGDQVVASRVASLAHAKNLGMEICFVDMPSEKRRAFRASEARLRRRVIAKGEPFDAGRPETALGGPRALAATLLQTYHHARIRSTEMAKAINAVQLGRGLVHLGGALHAQDIAAHLSKLRGVTPRIFWGPSLENPLAQTLGVTGQKQEETPAPKTQEKKKSLDSGRLGPRKRSYEELHQLGDI